MRNFSYFQTRFQKISINQKYTYTRNMVSKYSTYIFFFLYDNQQRIKCCSTKREMEMIRNCCFWKKIFVRRFSYIINKKWFRAAAEESFDMYVIKITVESWFFYSYRLFFSFFTEQLKMAYPLEFRR